MRRKRLARLLRKLGAMRRSLPSRDQLLIRWGAAKSEASHAFRFVQMQVPEENQDVTRATFQCRVDEGKLQEAEWARWTLPASLEPHRRRPCRPLDALCATDADRIGIAIPQE